MDNWRRIHCKLCQVNSIIQKSRRTSDGQLVHIRYDWICKNCLARPPQNQNRNLSPNESLQSTQTTSPPPNKDCNIGLDTLRKTKGLKFCHQNINSIRNKLVDVVSLLRDCKLDILALTESKLDPSRDKDHQFLIDGYQFFRFDRQCNRGGGTVIYVKNELDCD